MSTWDSGWLTSAGRILSFYRSLLLVTDLFAKVFISLSLWVLVPIVLTDPELIGAETKEGCLCRGDQCNSRSEEPRQAPRATLSRLLLCGSAAQRCAHTHAHIYFWESHYWAIYRECTVSDFSNGWTNPLRGQTNSLDLARKEVLRYLGSYSVLLYSWKLYILLFHFVS